MKEKFFIIDPPPVLFGYSDDDFDSLVSLYKLVFDSAPPGCGYKPSRAFAIEEALLFKHPLTTKKIKSFTDKDKDFVYEKESGRWRLK